MQPNSQEPMFIDLDDPAPRWFRCCGVIGALLVLALLVVPWTIDLERADDVTANQAGQGQMQVQSSAGYSPICEPSVDFPAFAQPAVSMALPSWMRLCDWLVEPATHPLPLPSEQTDTPYQPD